MKVFKVLSYVLVLSIITSCSNDDADDITNDSQIVEDEHTALLISDSESNVLNFLKPYDNTIQDFEASFSGGSIYATESGIYGVITHRSNNFTETFNFGGEIPHGSHSHDLGEQGMAAISFESQSPTHFKSEHGYVAVYNDGDATLSLFNESSIHNGSSPVRTINTGSAAHHGAMVVFPNGTLAVTELGNGAGLPESAKIISQNGEILFEDKPVIVTSGIHGNAGHDDVAVFGSNSGVLVVKSNGDQSLINYPDDFEDDVWFGSLLSTNDANLFVGYTGSKGAYFINIADEEITPILESSNLFKCIKSKDGDLIASLTKTGLLNITEVSTGLVKYQGKLNIAMDTEATDHGSVTSNIDLSEDFIYVSIPTQKKIIQIELNDLSNMKEFNLNITPYQFKILGAHFDH
ncbi:hypothetical protein [Algibacter pectinivorans]|uniref:Uncharacterized protein n=1 Tax=Algibacter pectinivorans TaxID=870482 RepID=A0A1I1P2F0_9FLAO|nr:hypothetical protein [Algibacter pectinivorans]SFD03742.1 hypothetical protein SAMN04487987_103100 [Algibacter pectinivorans]